MEGLNLKNGPAPIAMNGCPASSKDTTSQSPEGVGEPCYIDDLGAWKERNVKLGHLPSLLVKQQMWRDFFHGVLIRP
jgi:hypothetical protein